MTTCNRVIKRKTEAVKFSGGRHKNVIVEIPVGGRLIGFRLAKSRKTFYLPTADCIVWAMRIAKDAERAARREARKAAKR